MLLLSKVRNLGILSERLCAREAVWEAMLSKPIRLLQTGSESERPCERLCCVKGCVRGQSDSLTLFPFGLSHKVKWSVTRPLTDQTDQINQMCPKSLISCYPIHEEKSSYLLHCDGAGDILTISHCGAGNIFMNIPRVYILMIFFTVMAKILEKVFFPTNIFWIFSWLNSWLILNQNMIITQIFMSYVQRGE